MPLPSLSPTPGLLSYPALAAALIPFAARARDISGGIPSNQYASLAEYLIDYGHEFHPAPLPAGIALAEPGECVANAMALHVSSLGRFIYCEGYAGPLGHHHAWNYDLQTRTVIDTTWAYNPGIVYLGAAFPPFSRALRSLPEAKARSLTQSHAWTYALPAITMARRA